MPSIQIFILISGKICVFCGFVLGKWLALLDGRNEKEEVANKCTNQEVLGLSPRVFSILTSYLN